MGQQGEVGQGGGGWGHPQGAVHMAAARTVKRSWLGPGGANSDFLTWEN